MKKLLVAGFMLTVVITSTQAADVPVKAVAAPVYNWTGWYAGLNAGYGWGDPSSHLDFNPSVTAGTAPLAPGDYRTRTGGFIGGTQIGYNYQINTFVVGVETDFQYGNIKGTTTTPSTFLPTLADFAHFAESQKLSWFGTLRGRVGFLAMNNLLLYGTGGLAYGRVTADSQFRFDTTPFATYSGSATQTKTGWTIGGGAEWALNRAWSVKAEYLYYDLGGISVTGLQPGNASFSTLLNQKITGQIARLGLNFRLN